MGEVFGPNGALRRLRRDELPIAAGMIGVAITTTAGLAMLPGVPVALVVVAGVGFLPVVAWFGFGLTREAVARVRAR